MASPYSPAMSRERHPQMPQLLARRRHVDMGNRRHLDLRLQQLALDLAPGRRHGGGEKRLRHFVRYRLGLRIDQKIFFLDSEFVVIGHDPPLFCFR